MSEKDGRTGDRPPVLRRTFVILIMCQNWNPGNPLPNAEDAEIDIRKFEQYSMDPNNPRNKGKWTAFAAIGYDVQSLNGRHAGAQDVTVWQIDNNIEVPRLITNWLKVSQEEEEQQDES